MSETRANHYPAKRSAFTLIEVMGTLSVLLVIALAAVSMLATVTSIGLEGKKGNQARTDIARLAAKFRADVHAAGMGDIGDAGKSIDLTIGDDVIRYQINAEAMGISRERIVQDQPASIDWFGFTKRCRPEFDAQDGQVILRLTAKDARNPWIIEAALP